MSKPTQSYSLSWPNADAAVAPTATKITLHVDQTSISFPLKPESGRELQAGLQTLLQTFAEKQKAERPQR